MGDIADMMIDGMLCPECGEHTGNGTGYPKLCAGCKGLVIEPMGKRRKNKNKKEEDE